MMNALDELQRLLISQEQSYGKSHIRVANTLTTIADLLIVERRYKEAEQIYWRVFEIRHGAGQANLEVAALLQELGLLNAKQGCMDDAAHLLRRAAAIQKKLCGEHSEEYLATRALLKEISADEHLAALDDAPVLSAEAVVGRPEDFPWTDRFNRGVDLLDAGVYEGAEELFSCLVAFAQHFSPQTIQHARSLDHLARAYLFQNKYRESLVHFEQALSIFENIAGVDDMDTVECLEGAADAHAALAEYEQARFLYHWAMTVATAKHFDDPAERIGSKLAMLPFRSPGSVTDDESRAAVMEMTKPQRGRKRASATHVEQSAPVAASTPSPVSGGLKALMEDPGPSRKKKTVAAQKPALANMPAAASRESTPSSGAAPSPGAVDSGGQPQGDAHPNRSVAATAANQEDSSIKTPVSTLATYSQAARAENPGEPAGKDTERAAPSLESLDEFLKDLTPRKKKTTTTILKPNLAEIAAHMAQYQSGSGSVSTEQPHTGTPQAESPPHTYESQPDPTSASASFEDLLARSGIIKPQPEHNAEELLPEQASSTHSPQLPAPIMPAAELTEYVWEMHRQAAQEAFKQRNYAEAERRSLQGLEVARQIFRQDDRRLWQANCQLAAIYEARAKFVRAAHLYTSVLSMCRKALGPNHEDNAKVLEQLGALYLVQDRWADAEKCYLEAIKILEMTDVKAAALVMSKLDVVRRRQNRLMRKRPTR